MHCLNQAHFRRSSEKDMLPSVEEPPADSTPSASKESDAPPAPRLIPKGKIWVSPWVTLLRDKVDSNQPTARRRIAIRYGMPGRTRGLLKRKEVCKREVF